MLKSGKSQQTWASWSVDPPFLFQKRLMDRNMTLRTYQEYDKASALGNLTF